MGKSIKPLADASGAGHVRPQSARPAAREFSGSVVAAMVSQRTSEAVLGIDGRRFLELVRRHPEVRRLKGKTKLVVVPVADILALAAAESSRRDDDVESTECGQPASVDDVLRAVGRRVGSAR